jgi:small subunit ribosomal protein S16
VGFYNPVASGKEETLRLDLDRVDHWIGKGARPTERVSQLCKQARKTAASA